MEDFKKLPKMQSFKTGGSVKNAYCGGGRMKKGGEVESAAEIKQDKAIVKKAIAMHDKQEHKGEKTDLSKLKRGGRSKKEVGTVKKYCGGKSVKKMSDGKSTGELPQDLTDRIAREENEADAAVIPKMAKNAIEAVKGVGKRLYENVMGTPEQNAAAQARLDKYEASKAAAAPSAPVAKKRGGKC